MNETIQRVTNSKLFVWLLIALVVFAICWLAGITAKVEIGSGGVNVGVERHQR